MRSPQKIKIGGNYNPNRLDPKTYREVKEALRLSLCNLGYRVPNPSVLLLPVLLEDQEEYTFRIGVIGGGNSSSHPVASRKSKDSMLWLLENALREAREQGYRLEELPINLS